MVARVSHINMRRLSIEDKRCKLSGIPSKLVVMKERVTFNSSVGCVGSDATDQQQDNNNRNDDDWPWNDVGVGGGGSGGNHSKHGLGENGMCRLCVVRGFECFESVADITTTAVKRQRRHDDDNDDDMFWMIWTAVRERPPRTVSRMSLSILSPRAVETGQNRQ